MWRLKNMLLNNDWVKEKIKEEIKGYREYNQNNNDISNFEGCSKSSNQREVYITKTLFQEKSRISNK